MDGQFGDDEYAHRGIDYAKMAAFKRFISKAAVGTHGFAKRRNISVTEDGGIFYSGHGVAIFRQFGEGLGHKSLAARWMYENEARDPDSIKRRSLLGLGVHYHKGLMGCAMQMAIVDALVRGYRPVAYADIIDGSSSSIFDDPFISQELVDGCIQTCLLEGIVLQSGETAALPLLVRPQYTGEAQIFNGTVLGMLPPGYKALRRKVEKDDIIIGLISDRVHANGFTLIIERAMELPDKFNTMLPNERTLGEEVLLPTYSYTPFMEKVLDDRVPVHAFVPGTGGGVSKMSGGPEQYTYLIQRPLDLPPAVQFMLEIGVSKVSCLKAFHCGVGLWAIVPPASVEKILAIGQETGYNLGVFGRVTEGKRCVVLEYENNLVLEPPG